MIGIPWVEIVVAALCLFFAAIGTAVEASFASISRVRARSFVNDGRPGAERLLRMAEDPAPYLNASMLLRLILEVSAVVLVAKIFFTTVAEVWQQLVIPVGIMVVLSFIALGVAPRTIGRQHADTLALRLSWPLSVIATILGPVAGILVIVGNVLTPGRGFADGPFSSEAELRELVDLAQAREVIEDEKRKMLHSVFELGDTIAREVMVPRTEMVWIERTKTLQDGLLLASRTGFSRIPVVGDDLDDVVGVLYLKDIARKLSDRSFAQASENVDTLMRSPIFCPDSKPADELLREMQLTHSHLVVVIDEFGGTAGLVTIEDILEEIVGEIVDEYDQQEVPSVFEVGPNRYRVSARLAVSDLAELFDIDADDEDVDTVLGLIAMLLSRVPIAGSTAVWNGIKLVAERGVGRRTAIATVLASKEPVEKPAVDTGELPTKAEG